MSRCKNSPNNRTRNSSHSSSEEKVLGGLGKGGRSGHVHTPNISSRSILRTWKSLKVFPIVHFLSSCPRLAADKSKSVAEEEEEGIERVSRDNSITPLTNTSNTTISFRSSSHFILWKGPISRVERSMSSEEASFWLDVFFSFEEGGGGDLEEEEEEGVTNGDLKDILGDLNDPGVEEEVLVGERREEGR